MINDCVYSTGVGNRPFLISVEEKDFILLSFTVTGTYKYVFRIPKSQEPHNN